MRAWHKLKKIMFEVGVVNYNNNTVISKDNILFSLDDVILMKYIGKDKFGHDIFEHDIIEINGEKQQICYNICGSLVGNPYENKKLICENY